MEVNDFYKSRSITACMRASYDLMTENFKKVIRGSWTFSVPFAILGALVLYFLLPNKALHDWGEMNPWMSFILQTIVYGATIVMFFVTLFCMNRFIKKTAQKPAKEIATKKEKKEKEEKEENNQTQAEQASTLETAKGKKGKTFLSILRHFGGYLMTCFLGGLICLILACVTCLPAGIIATAQLYSQLGALDGDPLGVPAYFTPLLILVLIATCYVLIHIVYWLYISLAYQCASYKVQDEEKRRLKESRELASAEVALDMKKEMETTKF